MRRHDPPPSYAFGYLSPPESGNAINGLGEARKIRARQVFHSSSGEPLAWKALDDFFSIINPWRVLRHVLANTWQLRRSEGPVHPTRRPVEDPAAMTAQIKALARELGAGLAGVAEVTDDVLVCRRCVEDCPPRAIFEEKQLVRGERKWYVDFDKCIPYFVKTFGCAICIEVCPWSEPGRGAGLSELILRRRKERCA